MASPSDSLPDDMRPVIRTSGGGNWGMWAFVAVLLIGGVWLFSALNTARQAEQVPTVLAGEPSTGRIAPPPPLRLPEGARVLPADLGEAEVEQPTRAPASPPPAPAFVPSQPPPTPAFLPPTAPPTVLSEPPSGPAVIYERPVTGSRPDQRSDENGSDRINATRLLNPSHTISQGTIIPAVLETAFNSTRPGRVRALVQRDVYSFDGTRVLVPRGSRLFGEYQAGLNPGERRAAINWTRLLRPDGVSIALDSPASDPLGRGGVEGDVNSRFFSRFGEALLQTFLGIGAGIAIGEATGGGGTYVALPGSTQNVTQAAGSQRAGPVLEIDHGTSVSVYVARDLDFSSVDG
ncbi:TrbI/VirB10 family protein [Aurantiacibacter sp. D1-12]|uniref:TrbI/VirB10 family protein n=1 Tax=Aurantiacibacter sp. D1-12 TaxID=2993658 RepID=UPI00237D01F3|nr:TrbI/VirB10 family protein [Aurantiacibacter sp. D1-12]MDE1466117.1 conjugal transfer protein TrbI [Aurantiacibacter sp. D1-12]